MNHFLACYGLLVKNAAYKLSPQDKVKALNHEYDFLGTKYRAGDIPDLAEQVDVPAGPEEHHPELNQLVHNNMVFDASRSLTEDPKIWYAASLHDLGKTKTDKNIWPKQHNHEDLGEPLVVDLSKKLNVPPDVAELARLVAKNHLRCHTAMSLTDKALQRLFSEFKGDRKLLEDFVMACKADAQGRLGKASEPYPQAEYLLRKFDEFNNKPPPFSLAISGKDLTFVPPGKEMGAILKNLKERVLNGSLENDYDTLMQEARKFNV